MRSETAMQGGSEQQIPPQTADIALGRPSLSYVPTIQFGVGRTSVFAPSGFFIHRVTSLFFRFQLIRVTQTLPSLPYLLSTGNM